MSFPKVKYPEYDGFTSLLAKIALLGLTNSLSSPRKFPKYVTFITSRDWLPPLHWGRNCHLCHLTIQRKKSLPQGLVPTNLEGLREVARDSNKSTHKEILAGARSTQFQISGLKTNLGLQEHVAFGRGVLPQKSSLSLAGHSLATASADVSGWPWCQLCDELA